MNLQAVLTIRRHKDAIPAKKTDCLHAAAKDYPAAFYAQKDLEGFPDHRNDGHASASFGIYQNTLCLEIFTSAQKLGSDTAPVFEQPHRLPGYIRCPHICNSSGLVQI